MKASWGSIRILNSKARAIESWLGIDEGLSSILGVLSATRCLRDAGPANSKHNNYLKSLRNGVHAMARLESSDVLVQQAQKQVQQSAREDVMSGKVITEVTTQAQADELEIWQQGNLDMYEDEAVQKRLKLRRDHRVRNELQTWWLTVLRGEGKGVDEPDNPDAVVDFERYSMMMRRLYRIMLSRFDEADATKQIANDWLEDTKGASALNRKSLGDALFQLADLWTGGICPFEYAAFLRTLINKIVQVKTIIGPDGVEITVLMWRDEADCVHDPDMFGIDDSILMDGMDRGVSYRLQAQQAIKRSAEERASANLIQSHARKRGGKKKAKQREKAAKQIQATIRGKQTRKKLDADGSAGRRAGRLADGQQASKPIASRPRRPSTLGIPPGGSIGPGGVVLDAYGNPVLDAYGNPLVLSDSRVPPGGSIGPGGIILDANGDPVLGSDGKPLYVLGQPLSARPSRPPAGYLRSTRHTGFLDFLTERRGGEDVPSRMRTPSGAWPVRGADLPIWWEIVRLRSPPGSFFDGSSTSRPRLQMQYDGTHARCLPPLQLLRATASSRGLSHDQKQSSPRLTRMGAHDSPRARLGHPLNHPTVVVTVSHPKSPRAALPAPRPPPTPRTVSSRANIRSQY